MAKEIIPDSGNEESGLNGIEKKRFITSITSIIMNKVIWWSGYTRNKKKNKKSGMLHE
jgi:hypothetical protein